MSYVPKRPSAACWRTTFNQPDAPLYAPAVAPNSFDSFVEFAKPYISDTDLSHLRWAQAWLQKSCTPTAVENLPASPYTRPHLETLQTNGIVSPTDSATPNTHCYPVAEFKHGAERLRHIANTYGENAGTPDRRPPHRLFDWRDRVRLFKGKFAAPRDFKSFFHQFVVRRGRFVFKTRDGKCFTLDRMPMGHRDSAVIAHMTSLAILHCAIAIAGYETVTDVIIDDVAFACDTAEQTAAVARAFDDICARFNFTIGSRSEPATCIDHRGINVDLQTLRATMRPAFATKVADRWDIATTRPTPARCRSLAGSIVYYAMTSTRHLSAVPDVLRATTKLICHDSEAGRAQCIAVMRPLIEAIKSNSPFEIADAPPTDAGYLFTDATPTHWGALYIDRHGNATFERGDFRTYVGHAANGIIAACEAAATIEGLRALVPRQHVMTGIKIGVDNTNWFYAATDRWSMSWLHEYATLFKSECAQRNLAPMMYWLPSAEQAADSVVREGAPHDATTEIATQRLAEGTGRSVVLEAQAG